MEENTKRFLRFVQRSIQIQDELIEGFLEIKAGLLEINGFGGIVCSKRNAVISEIINLDD